MEDAFKTRERALENQFFRAVDKTLIERMRDDITTAEYRKSLRESTGIDDDRLLDELMAEGINPSTLMAFLLLPLARVAWADGRVDPNERDVVMRTAAGFGMKADSAGAELLSCWLDKPPTDELFEIWLDFGAEIAGNLSHASLETFTSTIQHRARTVAEATGGLLGMGCISPAERRVLKQLESAFPKINKELP